MSGAHVDAAVLNTRKHVFVAVVSLKAEAADECDCFRISEVLDAQVVDL